MLETRRRKSGQRGGGGRLAAAMCCVMLACWARLPTAAGQRALLADGDSGKGSSPTTSALPVDRYEWRISFRKGAPDCFEKNILVVNGQFQPTLRLKRGTMFELTLYNDLPNDYPSLTNGGVSLHWHGLSLVGFPWYDGVSYVQQCPIQPGQNFTYRFPVNDAPGTYFWHDHASGNHADGLAGLLIIEPEDGVPPYDKYDAEKSVFIHDWFHTQGDVLAMGLNRPIVPASQSVGRGAWNWVNSAQAILLNGNAYYNDCTMKFPIGANSTSCGVQTAAVAPGLAGQPMASAANPGCKHMEMTVDAGKTYLIRVVGAGTINLISLCFEGHNVTIVAADATPIEPLQVQCVDVNLGQSYDLLLTADQPVDNYWITGAAQYRAGSPNGYGILRYKGAKAGALPAGQPPNVGTIQPFTLDTVNAIRTRRTLLNASTAAPYDFPFPGQPGQRHTLLPPRIPTRRYTLDISQPALAQTGQLRWGLNNIAHAKTPSCRALMDSVYGNPNYLNNTAVLQGSQANDGVLGKETSTQNDTGRGIYLDSVSSGEGGELFPPFPVAGRHVVRVDIGDVVDILLQGNAATAFNGDPPGFMRNATQEQHPFHLHGHHFWLLGTGSGVFNASSSVINLRNPAYRYTATLPEGGWVLFRFIGDNRGLWLLHCHIFWHQYMGQAVLFAEGADKLPRPPGDMPACPSTCPAQFAPWRPEYVTRRFRDTPYEIPLPNFTPASG